MEMSLRVCWWWWLGDVRVGGGGKSLYQKKYFDRNNKRVHYKHDLI